MSGIVRRQHHGGYIPGGIRSRVSARTPARRSAARGGGSRPRLADVLALPARSEPGPEGEGGPRPPRRRVLALAPRPVRDGARLAGVPPPADVRLGGVDRRG